jgi:hypothetical protein
MLLKARLPLDGTARRSTVVPPHRDNRVAKIAAVLAVVALLGVAQRMGL